MVDILHGIIDSHACGDRAAGAVDIKAYILLGVLTLKVEELSDDKACGRIVDFVRENDYSVVEQA